jgi:hypothetical protein
MRKLFSPRSDRTELEQSPEQSFSTSMIDPVVDEISAELSSGPYLGRSTVDGPSGSPTRDDDVRNVLLLSGIGADSGT